MSIPANPFAFPASDDGRPSDGYGMTLRDWFAGQVLAGMLASESGESEYTPEYGAGRAYAFADQMLGQRGPA